MAGVRRALDAARRKVRGGLPRGRTVGRIPVRCGARPPPRPVPRGPFPDRRDHVRGRHGPRPRRGDLRLGRRGGAGAAAATSPRLSRELTLYIVHGWLHLAGYDDLRPGGQARDAPRRGPRDAASLKRRRAIPRFKLAYAPAGELRTTRPRHGRTDPARLPLRLAPERVLLGRHPRRAALPHDLRVQLDRRLRRRQLQGPLPPLRPGRPARPAGPGHGLVDPGDPDRRASS